MAATLTAALPGSTAAQSITNDKPIHVRSASMPTVNIGMNREEVVRSFSEMEARLGYRMGQLERQVAEVAATVRTLGRRDAHELESAERSGSKYDASAMLAELGRRDTGQYREEAWADLFDDAAQFDGTPSEELAASAMGALSSTTPSVRAAAARAVATWYGATAIDALKAMRTRETEPTVLRAIDVSLRAASVG